MKVVLPFVPSKTAVSPWIIQQDVIRLKVVVPSVNLLNDVVPFQGLQLVLWVRHN
jgi:hypothetical protein